MSTAILLPTCDTYLPVAGYTVERLAAWWPGHPEIHVSGLTRPAPAGWRTLPSKADSRDWVGVTLEAVDAIGELGFEWLYLILDDHPPFGPCNADYLNRLLPQNAAALGAVQVNLLGWDQYQPQQGEVLGAAHLHWQRNDGDFPWKFSLHPGFWHAGTLRALLASLRVNVPEARTARAFEARMDAACRALDPGLLERTYRVRGDGYSARRRWHEARLPRALSRQLIHAARLAARLGGPRGLAALDRALLPYQRYLNGPYPMFWSGLVRQGALHEEALRFLSWSGERSLLREVRRLAPSGS